MEVELSAILTVVQNHPKKIDNFLKTTWMHARCVHHMSLGEVESGVVFESPLKLTSCVDASFLATSAG